MIGYSNPRNNDLYLFFEPEEITRLKNGRVTGEYINHNDVRIIGSLEASINEEVCRRNQEKVHADISRDAQQNVLSMQVRMMQIVHDVLVENGCVEDHQGYRHVSLLDTNRLGFNEQLIYDALKVLAPEKR